MSDKKSTEQFLNKHQTDHEKNVVPACSAGTKDSAPTKLRQNCNSNGSSRSLPTNSPSLHASTKAVLDKEVRDKTDSYPQSEDDYEFDDSGFDSNTETGQDESKSTAQQESKYGFDDSSDETNFESDDDIQNERARVVLSSPSKSNTNNPFKNHPNGQLELEIDRKISTANTDSTVFDDSGFSDDYSGESLTESS